MKEVNAILEVIAKCNCPICGHYIEESYSRIYEEDEITCLNCDEIFTLLISYKNRR